MTKWFPEYFEKKYEAFERQKQKEQSELNNSNSENAVEQYYAKMRRKKAMQEKEEKMRAEIDLMVKDMDRQMLEDTILDWSKKPDLLPYLDYLKQQRQKVK